MTFSRGNLLQDNIATADPATGQASVRLPLPDPAVLQRLAKAFEPWLR